MDLSAELWRFGGGAVTDKVKLPLLPISKPFFSVLCSSGMLQILNWTLEFSQKFWPQYCFISVFLWRKRVQDFLSHCFAEVTPGIYFKHLWHEGTYDKGRLLTDKMLYANFKRFFYFLK